MEVKEESLCSAEEQLDSFLEKYSPAIEELTCAAFEKVKRILPQHTIMVYDNYNALVIGFGPSDRTSQAFLSIAAYPKWVTLFFLWGINLSDPQQLLKGSGSQVRSIVLKSATDLEKPEVLALIKQAVEIAGEPTLETAGKLIIKSISAKQRSRRPK